MKFRGIVQSRLASSRLPRKALLDIVDLPMFLTVTRQLNAAKNISSLVLTTSEDSSDQPLIEAAESARVKVSRGPLDDLFERLLRASKDLSDEDAIVRVWGDCPFVAPDIIDAMVEYFQKQQLDCLVNCEPVSRTLPPGLDVEIYRLGALRSLSENIEERLKEFPFEAVRKSDLKWECFTEEENLKEIHLTVDYDSDLVKVREIIDRIKPENGVVLWSQIKPLIAANPGLFKSEEQPRNKEYFSLLDDMGIKR